MGKILCFIYEEMAEFEVTFAFHRLKTVGKREIIPIGYEAKPLVSQSGFTYMPAATVKEAMEFEDVEALIIPGGPICEQKAELTELIQQLYKENKLIAAICNGPQFLGRAGILDHHRYTTSCSEDSIKKSGVADPFPRCNFVRNRVVRDRNIITATGRAFIDFSFEVLDWLHVFENREEWEAQYKDIRGLHTEK